MFDLFKNSKNLAPLPPKPKEDLPHAKLGISYKEWHNGHVNKHKWRNKRWAVLLVINGLFILSFALDLSLLEGSLSGSRLLGFYLMDPYNAMQTIFIALTQGHFPSLTMNFWWGVITIFLFYTLVGGRTFCSWLCPYHFIAENLEKIHDYLVKKRKIKEHTYNQSLRYVFWVGFLILAVLTQQLVFEDLNLVGITSRALIYGPGLILFWIIFIMIFEIVYSKRFWCRYVCPVGATYGMIGSISPVTIKFDLDKCGYCTDCQDVCLVPHELWFVKRGKATQEVHYTGNDCTKCGLCVDVCAGEALTYTIRGLDKLK